jgi:membrane-bound lytic murein transglycosylase A
LTLRTNSARRILLCACLALAACAPLKPAPAPQAACPVSCPPCPAEAPCAPLKPPPSAASYELSDWRDLPGWNNAPQLPALRAFASSCRRLQAARWRAACDAAAVLSNTDEADVRAFFEARFAPYRIVAPDGSRDGLVTGYYEPILRGSRAASGAFRYPVYGVPEDLIVVDLAILHPELNNLRLRGRLDGRRVVPYYERAEIEAPGRRVDAPVIAWVADPVELFFLQVQGSGQLELDSGARIRIGYADQNGHPYRSLGRHLIDRGELKFEQSSMQAIKAWAEANPDKLRAALDHNPSYVFFRELPAPDASASALAADGPPGAAGVALRAEFSIAVDPRYVPLGSPVFLATTSPLSERKLEKLVIAQDTGGAIRGAVRADFFWGSGAEAGAQAGRMRQRGAMWLVWPRGEPLPAQ